MAKFSKLSNNRVEYLGAPKINNRIKLLRKESFCVIDQPNLSKISDPELGGNN